MNKRKIPASKEAQIKVVHNKLTNKKMPVSCQVVISTALRKIKQCKVTHFPRDSTGFHLITVDMSKWVRQDNDTSVFTHVENFQH